MNDSTIPGQKEKILSLFKYLKDLCALRTSTVTDINKQTNLVCYYKNIPNDPENITVSYRDRVEEEEFDSNELITVKKQTFEKCPEPSRDIIEWLEKGWDDYRTDVAIKESIDNKNNNEQLEKFNDSPKRVAAYDSWIIKRQDWVTRQQKIRLTNDFFNKLYILYQDLERDAETIELVIGNGIIKHTDNKDINHPILLKRVSIEFDKLNNVIKVCDTDTESELYTTLLSTTKLDDINLSAIRELKNDLKEKFYHPLDRNDAYDFLKILAHSLSSKSKFIKSEDDEIGTEDKLLVYINPVLFVRKRIDGTIKAVEDIIHNVEQEGIIPPHLIELVSGGKLEINDELNELSIDELLAATSGESEEILLSKEANKEQLEIAKRIEKYNAVLVQGPPGTGKTHTIANLLGHFLAQGKNVLITSHTKKALKVLKEKVAPGIQNLCVTVLDDRNIDMERSIDGITEYMSKHTSMELKDKMAIAKQQRANLIKNLSKVRKKIFAIKNKEFEPIVFNGESYSPSKASEYVAENAEKLSYIPGKVELGQPLPLTIEELILLYQSNVGISDEEDIELDCDIPNPECILPPAEFSKNIDDYNYECKRIDEIQKLLNISTYYCDKQIIVQRDGVSLPLVKNFSTINLEDLKNRLTDFRSIEYWMIHVAVDGNKGGGFREKWLTLINLINETVEFSSSIANSQVGKNVDIPEQTDIDSVLPILTKMLELFKEKGKISFWDNVLNDNYKKIREIFKINGKIIASAQDCKTVIDALTLLKYRQNLQQYWDSILAVHNGIKFNDLDSNEPERIALNHIPTITKYLNLYHEDFAQIRFILQDICFDYEKAICIESLDSEFVKTQKIIDFITNKLPKYLELIKHYQDIERKKQDLCTLRNEVLSKKRQKSGLCNKLAKAIEEHNKEEYFHIFNEISSLYSKYELKTNRIRLLDKLKNYAPGWCNDIKNRIGIHGQRVVPDNITDAWKWKQLAGTIEEILSEPFENMQKESVSLSKELRLKTAELCEYSAWYHLLKATETDLDMRQALQGWKKTIKKIGKGTGKNVPILKREAKNKMAKCQKAVPAWIMPMNKALETLVPGENMFDVIIIDEASQSDITALAITYMAKKIIIVGDDKQVSPMAVGTDIDKMNSLIEMHIKNIIPNWHLYQANTSLYDIAGTTFQPLMLREHFRCVPDIIGFSNRLSYDYKIKPLRDASSSILLPATVNYRVNGERDSFGRKTNIEEAKYIVSLIMACIEQPEYESSSFGVISLLGKEQAVKIQELINTKLEPAVIEKHNILCGDASSFQGDERDVIFLSMVDNNSDDGPLNLASEGAGDSRKQRYNVAASRAKNQMWLVHSLDITRDLKEGDLRKFLLEYTLNPKSFNQQLDNIKEKSDSPFEEEVCAALVSRGYNIVQQWPVGAYRIDMVAICGDKKIAIECDGERYHSGAEKIREDMERQTILERIGWQFIRIRGSEYYRNKTQTIEKLVESLNRLGIEPEQSVTQEQDSKKYDLLDRVKERANIIRQEWEEEQSQITIENPEIIVNNHPEQLTFAPIAKENKKQSDVYDDRISNMILKMKENYNKGNYLEALVCANKIIKIDANNSIAATFRDNAKRKLLNSSISKWKTK